MGSLLIDLHDTNGQPRSRLGGKAHTLAGLARAGLPVPPAVVVPPDVDDSDLAAVADALAERFGAARLAIRSSADVEDGHDRSFAGRFRTELRVRPADAAAAIRRVRASRTDGPMGVLAMVMVDARVAGVAFSADPVTGDPTTTVVEAVTGTAEELVDGRCQPSRWRVTDGRITGPRDAHLVADDVVEGVADLARRVEERLGHPVDVEWACDDDGIRLLQARPITALPAAFVVPPDLPAGTWARDDVHFPEPLTRLTGSVLCPSVSTGLTATLRSVGVGLDRCEARLIDGYYYQRLVPAGVPERLLARGGSPPPAFAYGLWWRLHPDLRRHARAARAYLSTDRAARVIAERREGWSPSLLVDVGELAAVDLTAVAHRDLATHLRAAAGHFDRAWQAHTEYAAASLVTVGRLLHAATAALDVDPAEVVGLLAGHGAATRRLSDDLTPVRAAVADDPAALAAATAGDAEALRAGTGPGSAAFRAYIERHGRLPLAVEAAAPTLAEAPDLLLSTLTTPLGATTVDDSELESRLRAHPDAARLLRRLEQARSAYAIRDQDLLPALYALGEIRRAACEAGRRLVDAGLADVAADVFHLDLDEVTGWLDGARTVTSAVLAERRSSWQRSRRSRPPSVVGPPAVPPPSPRFLPRSARTLATAVQAAMAVTESAAAPGADGSIIGTAASPGVAIGTARVVRDPRDLVRLAPGEVLVCQLTTVAWAPAFARAAAVVTQAGGLLSHPAIQAREHGVPTVVGVAGAMEVIPDGATVRVDGTRGAVQVVAPPATRDGASTEVRHEAFDVDAYAAGTALTGAAVLEAADTTGIWAELEDSPASATELAARTRTDPAGVVVLLRALTSLGVTGRHADGRYVARQPRDAYRRARAHRASLADALRNPGDRHPAPYEDVVASLADHVGEPANDAVEAVLGGGRRVLDLGAGAAPYTRRLARVDADVELTLLDRAPVLDQVRPLLARDGTADRTHLLAGDLFEIDYPGGQDLVVIANVLHLFPDDRCRELLARAVEALSPDGRVAVIEPLPDESMDGPTEVALYAVGLYLRAPGGGVRTFSTYAAWLQAAGLVDVDRHDLGWAHLSCLTARRPG